MSLTHRIRTSIAAPYGLPPGIGDLRLLGMACRVAARHLAVRLGAADDLSRLATRYHTDKGLTIYPFHGYTPNYNRLFTPMRERALTLLEIGIARKRDRGLAGIGLPSLQLWADYFPKATIIGFDIDDFPQAAHDRIRVYQGDQGNPDDLRRVLADHPKLDIVVDDGSHASYHQQVSLQVLWPALARDGVYVIEDLDSQPAELEVALPRSRRTVEVLKDPRALAALTGPDAVATCFDSPLRGERDTMASIVHGTT